MAAVSATAANAINLVLRELGIAASGTRLVSPRTPAELVEAARLLAALADNTLHAGVTPADVDRWARLRFGIRATTEVLR